MNILWHKTCWSVFYFLFFNQNLPVFSHQQISCFLEVEVLKCELKRKRERERKRLVQAFFLLVHFFLFASHSNVCKWLNVVFVQQFRDLYLSEVMGGPTKAAELRHKPPESLNSSAGCSYHTHTHTHSAAFPVTAVHDRVELQASSSRTGVLMLPGRGDWRGAGTDRDW